MHRWPWVFALLGPLLLIRSAAVLASDEADVLDLGATYPDMDPDRLRLWLTISARKRFVEVSWKNAPVREDDLILLTAQEPTSFEKVKLPARTPLARFDVEGSGGAGHSYGTGRRPNRASGDPYEEVAEDEDEASGMAPPTVSSYTTPLVYWTANGGRTDVVAAIKPLASAQWFTTGVPFDYELSRNVTAHTGCYGYWASYVDGRGSIQATACLRAYPRWMNEMRSVVGGQRVRDLFIPGTHDSGSYRPDFDPLSRETLVTKYSLTQDDDIRGQLMHGVRYLDIRVGYYRATPEQFFINHGITRHRPLAEVIDQVNQFVAETNEIVIFGLKEFPVGFGKKLEVHHLLVQYLRTHFGDSVVHPSATWQASLRDIWTRQQNVILAYDKPEMVREYPELLFGSVEQRWGNVRKWDRLERYLRNVNKNDISRLSSRPVADMAELTPDTWGVILDKYGGLRKMADGVNWRLSALYRDELGATANIVAADFIRGTTLMEAAIEWNKRKVIH